MSWRRLALGIAAVTILSVGAARAQVPAGTSFTYQGRLTDGSGPATGSYDVQFILYDAAAGGSQVGPIVPKDGVVVTGGLFIVTLDFGAVFTGNKRWLEIGVRPGGSAGPYTILSPRQELTPALASQTAPWAGVSGKPSGFADNVDNDVLAALTCAIGQIAKWNGAAWACAADGDDTTSVNAVTNGGGITASITGRTLTLGSDATVQRRTVAPTCPAGQYLRSIAADGTPACVADADSGDITGVTAGTGLTGGGTAGSVTLNVNLAGTGVATTVSRSDHTHVQQNWTGFVLAPALSVTNSNSSNNIEDSVSAVRGVGLYGLLGESAFSYGRGVFGRNLATSGFADGVFGVSSSPTGRGVVGYVPVATGVNNGVWGQSDSTSGRGVYGLASASSGTNYGVYGETNSTLGYAGYFKGRIGTDSMINFGATTRQMIALYDVGYGIGVQNFAVYFRTGFDSRNGFAWFQGGSHADGQYDPGGGNLQMRLDGGGNLSVRGTVSPGGADFAEMLPAQDDALEAGDVLVIGLDGSLTRSTEPYQSTLAGVYSTKPGLLGGAGDGEDTTGRIPLAVAGVVPVKVTDENGPIRPGDALTSSSTPGHAMRASKVTVGGISLFPSGVVIGKALEALTSGTGAIRALVVLQ